jgi:hypothetical protein
MVVVVVVVVVMVMMDTLRIAEFLDVVHPVF